MNYCSLCKNDISFLLFVELVVAINIPGTCTFFVLPEDGQAGRNML
jgi:hypothetical protein